MIPKNILCITDRNEFREWLIKNSTTEKECWIAVKRGKTPPKDTLWYLDAVEEALCFGWIDSTVKNVDGVTLQRFGPRTKNGRWTELNKERYRRLEHLGMMTDAGRAVCPDLDAGFDIMPEIVAAFKDRPVAWQNFQDFPPLYQRARIDNIQRVVAKPKLFESRLTKLIEASELGEMIGDWHDCGRLLEDRILKDMTLDELWQLFPIALTPHQPQWKDWAIEEIANVSTLLSEYTPIISHIGSTAIPDIQAKPIIDILVEINPDTGWQRIKEAMESAGYICMSVSETRISFNKGYTPHGYADKVFHIHVHAIGDNDEICFRDYLITHPETAKEYETLKLSLLPQYRNDRNGYTEAKSRFVRNITALAKSES